MVKEKNRLVVGASYGFSDWLIQRISAAVLGTYFFYFIIRLIALSPSNYGEWVGFFSTFTQFFTVIAFVALCWHAWIGVRDIFMDYVKHTAVRLFLHALTVVVLIGYLGWAAKVLFQVG